MLFVDYFLKTEFCPKRLNMHGRGKLGIRLELRFSDPRESPLEIFGINALTKTNMWAEIGGETDSQYAFFISIYAKR